MRTGISAKKSLGQISVKTLRNVSRVSFPEENGLELCSDGRIVPVFTEDICWVLVASYVVEAGNTSGNGFTCAVVRECVVALVELGVRDRCGIDDRFVVTKHHGVSINGDSEIS